MSTLQPVEGILGTIVKVAERDERAANQLVRFALYESLVDQIDEVRPRLDHDTAKWMAERVTKAREVFDARGLEDEDVSKGLDMLEEYVSKDLIGAALSFFNRNHPRDDKGRFIRQNTENHGEAQSYVNRWKQVKLVDDDTPVVLHFTGADGKQAHEVARVKDFHDKLGELRADPDRTLTGVALDRRSIPKGSMNDMQHAAFDAMSSFTGADGAPVAATMARALPYDGDTPRNQSGNAADWNRPSGPGDRKSYRRLQLTGRALESVSVPGSTASTVGSMARLIGDLGPEAEKVLGPGVRRTAYRYRGTERRPDRGIVQEVEQAQRIAAALSSSKEGAREQAIEAIGRQATGRGDQPSLAVAAHYVDRKYSGWEQDQLELAMRGDTAVIGLLEAVPNEKLAAISIEAGELPPSQGVIIDADGDIVSQAQGFNGDHYLPFDLKNLADLHGGQYVRTRAAGGPTTEDIYTGLLSGARQVQVVSNSGVYTVEFDPDLRGGRRYTDKAQRMIGRYSKLLAAIEGGKLYETDIDATRRSELRLKAYEQMGWDPELGAEQYKALLKKERLKATVNQEDEEALFERAVAEVAEAERNQMQAGRPGHTTASRAKVIEDTLFEMRSQENADKVRAMVLDGKGYAAALKTLKQEFPFFIRDVRYEAVQDFAEGRRTRLPEAMSPNPHSRDKGYTDPGQTNPRSTLSPGDARLVPTARAAVGQGALVPTTAAATRPGQPTEAARPTEAQRDAATVASVTNDGKVIVPVVEGTKTLDKVIGPGSMVEDRLRAALGRSQGVLTYATMDATFTPHDAGESREFVRGGLPLALAHYYGAQKFAGNARGLATWLHNEADDLERQKFVQGLEDIRTRVTRWGEENDVDTDTMLRDVGGDADAFDSAVEEISGLVELVHPFADAAEDMVLADTSSGRPQPFPAILALGDKVANYDAFAAAALEDDPNLAGAIQDAQRNAKAFVNQIETLRHSYQLEAGKPAPNQEVLADTRPLLESMQRAWAYVTARKIAEVVDEGKEPAAKRLPVVKRHQQRRVVWHSPSESFSKRVLQQLDL